MVKILSADMLLGSLVSTLSHVDERGPRPSLRMIVHRPLLSFSPGWVARWPAGESSLSSGKEFCIVDGENANKSQCDQH